MDLAELKQLVHQGESEHLEFKESTGQRDKIGQTLCGFLNASGGMVLIGVTDQGHIVGQEVNDKTQQAISRIKNHIEPMPVIEVQYIALDKANKHVIALNAITDSSKRPYFYDNRAYIKTETTVTVMPREHIQHLMALNSQRNHPWEEGIAEGVTVADLDHNEILKTIREGVANRRIPEEYRTEDPEEALRRLKLLNGDQLLNAAVVLFAKEPGYWLPQCLIKLGRFRGSNKQEIMDSRQIEGNAFRLLYEALMFADRHISIRSYFPEDQLERVDQPLIPHKALREIFANAIAHRDYTIRGGSITFEIYDDRVDVWNYGSLMPGLTFAGLKAHDQSLPRNRLIANVLYYHALFESWGRGIDLIVNECVKAGLPEPEFFEKSGGFCVRIRTDEVTATEKLTNHLSPRQQEILVVLKQHEYLSTKQLQQKLSEAPKERTLRYDLKQLQKQGLVEHKGHGPTSVWYLVKNDS